MGCFFSLANSFTNYHVVRKRGALDFTANPIGRILLCLSGLLQIISCMVLLVLFAFCWGPGSFWKMLTCVLIHILMMSVLHFVTSKRSESADQLSMRHSYFTLCHKFAAWFSIKSTSLHLLWSYHGFFDEVDVLQSFSSMEKL